MRTAPLNCDFCCDPAPIVADYHCKPFTIKLVINRLTFNCSYDDRWAACAECAALIDAEDRKGLLELSASRYPPTELGRQAIKELVSAVQDKFWQLRDGEKRAVGPEENQAHSVVN